MDIFVRSTLIYVGRFQTGADNSGELSWRKEAFRSAFRVASASSRNSRGPDRPTRHQRALTNHPVSHSNKVKPTGRSGPPHIADQSSLPSPQAIAQLVKPE